MPRADPLAQLLRGSELSTVNIEEQTVKLASFFPLCESRGADSKNGHNVQAFQKGLFIEYSLGIFRQLLFECCKHFKYLLAVV